MEYIESKWSKDWGDRMTELVIIGQDINSEEITAQLNACLLNDDEVIRYKMKSTFDDPFPEY
jgi:hypothetical protein